MPLKFLVLSKDPFTFVEHCISLGHLLSKYNVGATGGQHPKSVRLNFNPLVQMYFL